MLKISISEYYKSWCNCHTCIKLPVVTTIMVCLVVYFMK
jgi:hypothetical protein